MRRWLKLALAAIVVAIVVIWAFRPPPVLVDGAAVARGPLRVTVDEEGETRVRERFVVSAPLPGRMRRIELEPGDPVVAQETVLAQFEPADPALLDVRTRAEIEARVRAAEAALGAARADRQRVAADLGFARTELQRYRDLAEAGIAARDRVDAAERQVRMLEEGLRSAEFSVNTALHQRDVARASLLQSRRGSTAPIELRSPIDGIVLRRLQESEAIVPAGQPLLEIGSLDNLEIVADFLSSAAVRVEPGQRVIVDQWGGGEPLEGRVRRVEPSGFMKISALGVEEQRVNVLIDFVTARTERVALGDGFRVEVRVVAWEGEAVLKVPVSSLFRVGDRWAVYAIEDGRAVRRFVEIGQRNGLEAEVLSGLAEGAPVVVYPGEAVADGVGVALRGSS